MVKMLSPWLTLVASFLETPHMGAIQVLRNADASDGGGSDFPEKALRRCNVQCY